jgi:alanine dehydrogenase
VARTSTIAFLNAALPFIFEIANRGIMKAIAVNPALELAVQINRGEPRHLIGFPWAPEKSRQFEV